MLQTKECTHLFFKFILVSSSSLIVQDSLPHRAMLQTKECKHLFFKFILVSSSSLIVQDSLPHRAMLQTKECTYLFFKFILVSSSSLSIQDSLPHRTMLQTKECTHLFYKFILVSSSSLSVQDSLPHRAMLQTKECTHLFYKFILVSSSLQISTMLFAVDSLTLISSDVMSSILIIELRYSNFGTSSTSVPSIRTKPIPLRANTFVFASLIFRPEVSLCLFTALASFSNSSFDVVIRLISSAYRGNAKKLLSAATYPLTVLVEVERVGQRFLVESRRLHEYFHRLIISPLTDQPAGRFGDEAVIT